jgi:prepilin-type N-terminal cleavage/methylation domain-containing protein
MYQSEQTKSVRRTKELEPGSMEDIEFNARSLKFCMRNIGSAMLGKAVGGLMPPSQTVREQRYLTGFTPLDKAACGLMSPPQAVRRQNYLTGFTLIELLIVVVVIGIAAMIAVPMMSSAASMQIRSAANMIAADLEYAKSMAISRGQNYSVIFTGNKTYEIHDQSGLIQHPVKKRDFIINFGSDSRLNRVTIVNADFDPDSSQTITFDYLGSPYSGTGTSNPLNSGVITLQAGGITKTVNVEPVTGYISITD